MTSSQASSPHDFFTRFPWQWGRHGRQAGQFKWVHNIGIDSKGNLYTAEVGFGRRVQKFNAVR